MGLFDDLNKAMKQAGEEIKKSGLDQRMNDLEQGLDNAGKDIDRTLKNSSSETVTMQNNSPSSLMGNLQPHPGYAKITAWVKRRCSTQISGLSDPYQKRLELEQISSEACTGLSPKAKKGFLAYLKSQNSEQLLK